MFMDPPISQQHGDMLMGNAAASSNNSGLEEMLMCSPKISHHKQQQHDNNTNANGGSKGTIGNNNKPQPEQALKCPRCESTNTKFCYYNNYSLSQPRYFCKSCRRYWTQGGTLRNVPVGGGCRKANKRPSSSSSSSKRPINLSHADPPQFSAEATSILNPSLLINGNGNGFPLATDLGLCHFGTNGMPPIFPLQNHKAFDHHQHPDRDLSFLGTTLGLHGMISNNNTTTGSSPVNIPGFFDTIRNGLFNEPQHQKSSFHNLYGEFPGPCEEMGSILKRDMMISDHSEGENRILWGFPWNGNISDEVDSARSGGSWNGMNSAAANWQGLINSPLM